MTDQKTTSIDLRSDTVTKPTPEMRKAMFEAKVGDDVFGDDYTLKELEAYGAKLLGKEAAIFVPSGTMGNLIAILLHCSERGSEMIVGDKSHIYLFEGGGSAMLGGVHSRVIKNQPDGTMDIKEMEAAIRPVDDHQPVTRLVCIENTHNKCGGIVLKTEYMDAVGEFCQKNKLKFHVDGARLWNAAVKLNVPPARLVKSADSVLVCLSKALAAPIGSLLVGKADFIVQARRLRKSLGGGMRQVGVIAAPAMLSLTKMIDRLADDHANTALLAKELADAPGISPLAAPDSNMFFITLQDNVKINAEQVCKLLEEPQAVDGVQCNVLCGDFDPRTIRFVLHYHITKEDVVQAAKRIRLTMQKLVAKP